MVPAGQPWAKPTELGRLLGEVQGEPISSVPPSHIAWQWDEMVFTFELTEHDGVVQLELLVTIEDRDEAAVAALEFDAFLDRLAPYLAGDELTFAAFADVDAQERLLEVYAERFGIDRTRGLDFVASIRRALAAREDRFVADGSLDVTGLESAWQDTHPGS
ncbi:hypothetical protein [Flexivirga oryzae]|uniref:Uncharacterized protein n=1 Tax=Flexivirga oryzae TaxID=1794944 RepID=A0A839NA83_9MICO|nr:hypothetical protein [Flexivirga oryzae]MBB2894650.1 hypothetical protein [Flexivirga oryzae]